MSSGLDVEALLDSTANADGGNGTPEPQLVTTPQTRRERTADHASPGSHRSSRRRSRSRDSGRHNGRRNNTNNNRQDRDDDGRGGDFYRGSGRGANRSGSDESDRYYRPRRGGSDRHRERSPRRSYNRRSNNDYRRRSPSPPRDRSRSRTPQPTEDERDRRTVFVQQLANRLRTKDLILFFEKAGPVKEAQIVKDRVSGRSKGVGYVEFKDEATVPKAIQLTGQKLLGIPIIAQLTEAEKNRQARTTEGTTASSGVPFHRLYVGNIHFSITETDLEKVFGPFGELEFVQLQKEDMGRSRGYGFVQFRDPESAKEALDKMNGFDLAGRPIRVGLGNDKFTSESTASLLSRFPNQQQFQGSEFSGRGGRGAHAGGTSNFDRIGGRDNDKGAGGASALDDSDVAGVNFNNFSRDALMRKLARTEEPADLKQDRLKNKPTADPKKLPPHLSNVSQASRCVVLRNMFDPDATPEDEDWEKKLVQEIKEECQESYGKVAHIALDKNSQGDVYVKFFDLKGGENAMKGLNGRFFDGRQISAQPVVDAIYSSLFGRTSAL